MTLPRPGWTDERVEQVIGNLLRAGVIAAALVVFGGGVRFLMHEGTAPVPDRSTFREGPDYLRKPLEIIRHAWHGDDRAIIQLGLLLLIATPVARVLFSVFAFALEQDRTYVLVTLVVLAILLYSLFSGHLG
jgi:uncharacterized membrane protein